MTKRELAAAVELQIYAGLDPDSSNYVAERIVQAIDRAHARGHTNPGPTQTEGARATAELARQGVTTSPAQMHRALLAALCPGHPEALAS
jgi:hypothetical protein